MVRGVVEAVRRLGDRDDVVCYLSQLVAEFAPRVLGEALA